MKQNEEQLAEDTVELTAVPTEELSSVEFDPTEATGEVFYEEPEPEAKEDNAMVSTRRGAHAAAAGAAMAAADKTSKGAHMSKAKKTKKKRAGKIALISVASVLGAVALAWGAGVAYFNLHFMPNTSIDGTDVSMMKVSDAQEYFDEKVEGYTVSVSGDDYYLLVPGEDISFTADTAGLLKAAVKDSNPWLWPLNLAEDKTYDFTGFCNWDTGALDNILAAYTETHNLGVTPPADAYVDYVAENGRYEVISEVVGKTYVSESVQAEAAAAVTSMATHVDLSNESLMLPELYSDDETLISNAEDCNSYLGADFDLVIDIDDRWSSPGRVLDHIDGSIISQWISIEEDGVHFDEDAMRQWARYYADSHYTYRTDRTYTRPDGVTVTQGGGRYGWDYNTDTLYNLLVDSILNGTTGSVTVPMTQSAYYWVDRNVASDLGDTYVDINIPTQRVIYVLNGEIVMEVPTVSGDVNSGQSTPTGVWYITRKDSPTHLKDVDPITGEPYDVPVNYWMAFINNSHGLHDNPNRYDKDFGPLWAFRNGGSHGCCNLRSYDARTLYGIIEVGCPVIVHWN